MKSQLMDHVLQMLEACTNLCNPVHALAGNTGPLQRTHTNES